MAPKWRHRATAEDRAAWMGATTERIRQRGAEALMSAMISRDSAMARGDFDRGAAASSTEDAETALRRRGARLQADVARAQNRDLTPDEINEAKAQLEAMYLQLGRTSMRFAPQRHTAYILGRPVQAHLGVRKERDPARAPDRAPFPESGPLPGPVPGRGPGAGAQGPGRGALAFGPRWPASSSARIPSGACHHAC